MDAAENPTDRQARNLILVAEEHGFRRCPELHPRAYDAELHVDAAAARAFLERHHPTALADALLRPDPIGPEEAAERILESGTVSLADVESVIAAAEARGFVAPTNDLPLLAIVIRFDQGKAAVAFLWETEPATLGELLGDRTLLAPTPADAWIPCSSCGR